LVAAGAARIAPASIKEKFARAPARGEHPQAYIECGMQTASQRQGYDGAEYCAPQRENRRDSDCRQRQTQYLYSRAAMMDSGAAWFAPD